jgi:hypothetical protein
LWATHSREDLFDPESELGKIRLQRYRAASKRKEVIIPQYNTKKLNKGRGRSAINVETF